MAEPFQTRITVRGYELDSQGHLHNAVYHQYGDHARWECLRAAGVSVDDLLASGIGPVTLESTSDSIVSCGVARRSPCRVRSCGANARPSG